MRHTARRIALIATITAASTAGAMIANAFTHHQTAVSVRAGAYAVQGTPIGLDVHQRLTLNGVALGAPIGEVLPPCDGQPSAATTFCHLPLTGQANEDRSADVVGFAAGTDDDGKPLVTGMTIATGPDDTTVVGVSAIVRPEEGLPMMVRLTSAYGPPSSTNVDMQSATWDMGDQRLTLDKSFGNTEITLSR